MTKNYLHYAIAAAFFLASGTSKVAFAIEETAQSNDTVGSAQRLVIGSSGIVEVAGAIGVMSPLSPVTDDVDFYSFHARAGDVVTIDIDGGIKPAGSSVRSVDTVIAIYGPDVSTTPRQINDVPIGSVDAGSISRADARLDNVHLAVTGVYTVGVAGSGRAFLSGGAVTPFVSRSTANGSYTLIISGVTPTLKQISIDIKPGADSIAPINPKSRGNVPVALLSAADFDALKVDPGSVAFGPTGTETKGRCSKGGADVNADGRLDLICHFDNQAAGFGEDHEEGIVTGTIGGLPFEGRGWLKVFPVKKDKD